MCTPCRGTGRVVSNLGGESHEVTCPWCGGSGQFIPGRNAQDAPAESAGGSKTAPAVETAVPPVDAT
jgi:DnaJ-class molecular chaperone